MASPPVRATAATDFVTSGTSITRTAATGEASGDGIILFLFIEPGHTGISGPVGWTPIGSKVLSDGEIYVYTIRRGASAPDRTCTWTGSTGYAEASSVTLSGIVGSGEFIDGWSWGTITATATITSPPITPTTIETTIVCGAFNWTNGWGAATAPTGYTNAAGGGFTDTQLAYKTLATAVLETPSAWGAAAGASPGVGITLAVASQAIAASTVNAPPSPSAPQPRTSVGMRGALALSPLALRPALQLLGDDLYEASYIAPPAVPYVAPSFALPPSLPQPMAISGRVARVVGPGQLTLGSGLMQAAAVPPFFAGDVLAALSPFTASGSGTVTAAGITSSGAAALSSFAASAVMVQSFLASATIAWSTFTCSGVAAEAFSGTCTAAMQSFTASGVCAESFPSSGTAAMSANTASGTGAETFTGTGTAACSPFTASGSGSTGTVFTGAASAAMSPYAASGTGVESFSGAGAPAASPFACSAVGVESFSSSGAVTWSTFTANGSGGVGTIFAGNGSAAMASFTASAAGAEAFSGAGSPARSTFAASGVAVETFTCAGAAAMSPNAASGAGGTGTIFAGNGSPSMSSYAASGASVESFTGAATTSVQSMACTAAGVELFTSTGTASCVSFAGSGAGGLGSLAITGAASAAMAPFAAFGRDQPPSNTGGSSMVINRGRVALDAMIVRFRRGR